MISIIFFIIFFLNCLTAADESLNCFGRIAINCGSSISNIEEFDGINWIKDVPSKYTCSPQLRGSSTSSCSMEDMMNVDHVPYRTARISRSEFSYMFQVNSGQIFIGLYFNPASYQGFKKYDDFFTVEAGNFTLLSNFSASLNADFLGVKYFVKKYYMIVEENQNLTLKFTPVSNAYAFVNGVEIIPLSSGLYYTHDDDPGAQVIGQKSQIFIDNSTGLELVHRSNIRDNSFISSGDDSNMFRSAIHTNRKPNMINNFTWNVPVDVGFGYLVRLYFCEVQLDNEFSIYIDGTIANIKGLPVQDIPQYRDYVVMMKGHKQEGRRDLSIAMQLKGGELSTSPFKGFEVLKMSNPDNSLASSNPLPLLQASPSWTLQKFILLLVLGNGYTMSTVTIVAITILNTVVYMLRQIWGEKSDEETNPPLTSMEGCRRFSFAQILSATKNFSDEFVIGRGGFGKVYKGFIDKGQQVVALKRLNSNSKQGALEFWTEVETLSTLRHVHLVSLIGYCNENQEMILVYEYMPHGTLADHLYKLGHESNNSNFLSWEQRLRICVGAARGLDYLHVGTDFRVIHRDIKSSNILLDENFVARISDFGLAKVVNEQLQSYVSTNVKGTFGYLDPHYFVNRKITRKTDVYAFGVVLLEVLSGRLAVNSRLPESQRGLTMWATKYINKGETSHIIDPNIKEQISHDCLKIFVEISEKCLHIDPKKRPTMANLVVQLELALALQSISESSIPREISSMNEVYPCTDETIQSSDVQNISIRPKKEANKNLLGILVDPFRKKDSGYRIPTLKLSWEVFWKRTKVSKKDNLLSPDVLCPCFTISEILAATNNFDENLIISSDSFYTVYEGFLPTKVAIERVRYAPEDKIYKICREIGMLSKIKHIYLASLIGYCYHEGEIITVYEYVGKGTLSSYLYKAQLEPLPWKIRLQICINTAKGLRHLHAGWPMIYHRDVRPANIFLDNNLVPKLLNFGFSYFGPVADLGSASTTLLGGQQYAHLPPEFFRLRMWTEKSDVYSFGLILLEVICGITAMNHDTYTDFGDYSYIPHLPHLIKRSIQTKTLHQTIDQDLRGKITVGCLNEYIKVALSCLLDQPTSRPSMDKVVECLELALEAQEAVEVMSETNISYEFVHSSGSNLENMYQELSCLASETYLQQSHPGSNVKIFTSIATFDFGDSMSR